MGGREGEWWDVGSGSERAVGGGLEETEKRKWRENQAERPGERKNTDGNEKMQTHGETT